MTNKLPITEMLEKMQKEGKDIIVYNFNLPKIRSLEEASIKKAKEEEQSRIVGILEEMVEDYSHRFYTSNYGNKTMEKDEIEKNILQEAITRITS